MRLSRHRGQPHAGAVRRGDGAQYPVALHRGLRLLLRLHLWRLGRDAGRCRLHSHHGLRHGHRAHAHVRRLLGCEDGGGGWADHGGGRDEHPHHRVLHARVALLPVVLRVARQLQRQGQDQVPLHGHLPRLFPGVAILRVRAAVLVRGQAPLRGQRRLREHVHPYLLHVHARGGDRAGGKRGHGRGEGNGRREPLLQCGGPRVGDRLQRVGGRDAVEDGGAHRLRERLLLVPRAARAESVQRLLPPHRARNHGRARGPERERQEHGDPADRALLRP
mmetsp:Transcript_16353/g.38993  ORF Transcript_16353/g.38993 Transcript_16353/m.38993 type:complete len:276 (+) Transcript_16353:830-1657(+)